MEMSNKMEYWDELKSVPEEAKKTISGGRLSGFTDISPQWRLQRMTEVFGPCGVGWKYTIDKKWTEDGSDGQKMCFVDVSVYYYTNGAWSEAVPGTGGNMLVTKETSGLHTSDEGYKMALTDALGVAMKAIGLGADVYSGGKVAPQSKYQKSNNASGNTKKATAPQVKFMAKKLFDKALEGQIILDEFKVKKLEDITMSKVNDVLEFIDNYEKK